MGVAWSSSAALNTPAESWQHGARLGGRLHVAGASSAFELPLPPPTARHWVIDAVVPIGDTGSLEADPLAALLRGAAVGFLVTACEAAVMAERLAPQLRKLQERAQHSLALGWLRDSHM